MIKQEKETTKRGVVNGTTKAGIEDGGLGGGGRGNEGARERGNEGRRKRWRKGGRAREEGRKRSDV